MTEKTIRRLKIENFKSIDSLEDKGACSVFGIRWGEWLGQEQFL